MSFCQGLKLALRAIFPESVDSHRNCTKHLEPKVLERFGKEEGGNRDDMRLLYWMAVKTCSPVHSQQLLDTIEQRHPKAYRHLTNATYEGDDGKQKQGVTLNQWTNAHRKANNWGKTASSGAESSMQ